MAEEFNEEVFTLIDEEGVETKFELLERAEFEGKEYFALIPAEKNPDFEEGDYVILRLESVDDSDEATLVTIDDDDEFERVADFFDDLLFDEVDYDESSESEEK